MKSISLTILAIVALVFAQMVVAKPPSWDTVNSGKQRFKLLQQFGNAAVLDQETGLVWEQSPNTSTQTWQNAHLHCNTSTVGDRKGWRLPTVQELASLVDPTQVDPALPPHHPFSNIQLSLYYWTATSVNNSSKAWIVDFADGVMGDVDKVNDHFVWCVRGGSGVDTQ